MWSYLERTVKVAQGVLVCLVLLRGYSLLGNLQQETTERRAVVASVPPLLQDQAGKVAQVVTSELRETRKMLRDEAKATREAAHVELAAITGVVDRRAGEIVGVVDRHLGAADKTLAEAGKTLAEADKLLARYASIPDEAAYANRWLWDCQQFSGCLQSQTLALVGSARATLGAVAKAAPDVTESVRQSSVAVAEGVPAIVQDSHGFVENMRKLTTRKWYDRLLGVGVASGMTLVGVTK